MDEYRPFPKDQPDDPAASPVSALPAEELEPQPQPHVAQADEEDGAAEGLERHAPDTEHPGGHLHGTVARLNRPRRFGFLRADDGAEVFFHASAIDTGPSAFDALRPGQEVEFDCHQDEQGRGLAATVVTITGEPPPEAPRPPRPPRAERAERGERAERSGRAGRAAVPAGGGWHVTVLKERYDLPVAAQLERLLNERNVRPGNFTVSLWEGQEGVECWVAYHTGDEPRRPDR